MNRDHNFVVVSSFTPEQFSNSGRRNSNLKKMFPGVNEDDIRVLKISTTQDVLFYRNYAYHEVAKLKAIRVNFADAKAQEYLSMEPEIWGPFIDRIMKAKKTKVVSWGFSGLSYPRGRDLPHDAISVDGFNSVSDAILGSDFDDDVEFPENIGELMDAHEKVGTIIYRLVASADY